MASAMFCQHYSVDDFGCIYGFYHQPGAIRGWAAEGATEMESCPFGRAYIQPNSLLEDDSVDRKQLVPIADKNSVTHGNPCFVCDGLGYAFERLNGSHLEVRIRTIASPTFVVIGDFKTLNTMKTVITFLADRCLAHWT